MLDLLFSILEIIIMMMIYLRVQASRFLISKKKKTNLMFYTYKLVILQRFTESLLGARDRAVSREYCVKRSKY